MGGWRMLFVAALLCGCQVKHEQTTTWHDDADDVPRPRPRVDADDPTRVEAMKLHALAQNVQTARDAIEEAAALRRLQAWQTDHQTTFDIAAVRGDTARNVTESLSTYDAPLRTTLTIYRGQQVIYTFTFVPHDNRNLTLLGR